MDLQVILVILVFVAALLYVGRYLYRLATAKSACGGSCKCGVDFSAIQPEKVKA